MPPAARPLKCKGKGQNRAPETGSGSSDLGPSHHLSLMVEKSTSLSWHGEWGGLWAKRKITDVKVMRGEKDRIHLGGWAKFSFLIWSSGAYPFLQISNLRQLKMLSSSVLSYWFGLYRGNYFWQQSTACPSRWLREYKPHKHLKPFCWLTASEWKALPIVFAFWNAKIIGTTTGLNGIVKVTLARGGNTNEYFKVRTFSPPEGYI